MTKLIFLLLITASMPCMAAGNFISNFDIDMKKNSKLADTVAEFYSGSKKLNKRSSLNILIATDKKILNLVKLSPKDPQLNFLKGLNSSLLASIYKTLNDKRFNQAQKNTAFYYKKSIQLDNSKPLQLSTNAYATIKISLPENYRIEAIQKELSLGGNGDNESQYWYLHWSNINALKEAKRYTEATQALHEMQQELKQQGLDQSVFNTISSQAKTDLNNAIQQNKSSLKKKEISKSKNVTTEMKPLTKIIISVVSLFLVGLIASKLYDASIKNKAK